ncbi:tripartite tricarboxylate transporter TctB family protein [Pelagibius sp.]|uniref:tripartite tricarboxylate transporter TctB family protein n=1 Tax=Pelagibius sp. TaxID=1931238 RepID=UPI002632B7F5|nr:tripartite tricarboxylate transporter TctB family protein [Pelagibius sp.]
MSLNRDVVVALLLLLLCGVFFWESGNIQLTDYGQLDSTVWPRIILGALLIASLVYLWQALRGAASEDAGAAPQAAAGAAGGGSAGTGPGGLAGWISRYRNALLCYALFLTFLLTLPILGMLLGGILFVFAALTALGRPSLKLVPLHAAIAVGTVGAMWAVFTFGLRVFLPEGVLFSFQ